MSYRDLREWLEQVDRMGELVHVNGAHWDLEACAAAATIASDNMVLFDEFPGYPHGYRVLASFNRGSLTRFSVTSGWSTDAHGVALTRAWKERLREFTPTPPKWVKDGPVRENIDRGEDVDVLKFPVPRRHKREGGRYIGTADTVILKDPDTGRYNLGTYRLQVHDGKTLGILTSEGKDGRIIMDKYHGMGKACPVVAHVGIDPGVFFASTYQIVHLDHVSELDFAGWLKGQPEEIFPGEYTGLPILARAEIALEGEIPPDKVRREGPFAEWMGYSQARELPIIDLKAVYYRNNPILTSTMGEGAHPPGKRGLRSDFKNSALIWDQMEKAGIRGIQGVATYTQRLVVISIKNLYPGHSRQAALLASQCHAGAYGGSWVIVVDEDIDPSNIQDVLWAVIMRTEPKRAIQLIEYCWGSVLTLQDPAYLLKTEYGMQGEKATYMSKAIIDACKPIEWDPTWHQEIYIDPALKKQVREKWGHLMGKK